MADKEILIRISSKDMSAPDLAKARESLAGIGLEAKKVNAHSKDMGGVLGGLGPMIATTFSVGAIIGFGKEILRDADALVKLSDKTGIAIEPLQRLKYAAEQSGNTFEQITSAVSMMQKRLAGGDDSATGALAKLGISFDHFVALSPDQQFKAIAAEVRKIEDPMERVKVATDLFGRSGAEVLPTLIADIQKLGTEAPAMSQKAVRALDDFGDGLSRAWGWTKKLAVETAGTLVDAISRLAGAANALHRGDLQGLVDKLADLETELPKVVGGLKPLAVASTGVALSMDDAARAGKDLDASLKDQQAAVKKAGDEAARAAQAFRGLVDAASGQKAQDDAREVVRVYEALVARGLQPTAQFAYQLAQANALLGRSVPVEPLGNLNDVLQDVLASGQQLALVPPPLFLSLPPDTRARWQQVADAIRAVPALLEDVTSHGVPDALKRPASEAIPFWKEHAKSIGHVADAFGGLSRVAEMSGHKTTAALAGVASTMAGLLKEGKVFEAGMAGVLGLLTTFADKLFKTEGKKVNDLRDAFIAAAGGLHALNVKAAEAGMTLDQLLRASKVKDFEAAVAALEAGMGRYNQRLAETKALQDEIAGLEGQIEALRKSSIPTWEQLNTIAGEYGINLDGLGTTIQQLRVDELSRKFLDAFNAMTKGGADVGGVLVGMSDEISALVVQSLKFGTAIPENMRPLIEELARSGQLLGANKEKIIDLSGLKWGGPVETEADKITTAIGDLVGKLDELIAKLSGLTSVSGGVADAITRQWAREPWADWKIPSFPGADAWDLPGHAAGGVFSRPHLARIAEAGQAEIVGSVDFIERALVGALRRVGLGAVMPGGGGSGPSRTVIENRIYLDGREVTGQLLRWMPDVLAAHGVR